MIIQGSNNPLIIQFDSDIENIPVLVITLWSGCECSSEMVKRWDISDIEISKDTAICPISEDLTKSLPNENLVIEAKGLDENGNTIFWDQYKMGVKTRRDKVIMLTQTE